MHSEIDAGVIVGTGGGPAAQADEETEDEEFADWRALSLPTIQEYWINEEDTVYDSL